MKYCNPLLSPSSQISPLPLIPPPPPSLFRGRKLMSPLSIKSPSLSSPNYSSLIKIVCINQTRLFKTSCELICDGLFINWKFGFDSDHRLYDLKLLYLSFSTLYSSSLWRTDTIIISKLNRPPSPPNLY